MSTDGCSALKSHFVAVEDDDDRGVNETRGLACELVAWRFVTQLTQREAIDHLCSALRESATDITTPPQNYGAESSTAGEQTPLLTDDANEDESDSLARVYRGLSALEIAVVCDAKEFMSQKAIQRIISGIFWGDIVFWENLSTHATNTRKARLYNKERSDPFCRLRVPVYLKIFEALFFLAFLAFYYTVLVQKPFATVYTSEILLYVWIASFAYNELGEFFDAGSTLYAKDFWALWDIGIIATGTAFFCLRMIGLAKKDHKITDVAFDVLSVEALFLVPRVGTADRLIPTGFDTTFVFLARGQYSAGGMNWILIKISPLLGPPLMFCFVILTNLLLLTVLLSLLSSRLTQVQSSAKQERDFVFGVYVLEASTSKRLTYFVPPLPEICFECWLPISSVSPSSSRMLVLRAVRVKSTPLDICVQADPSSQNLLSLLLRPLRVVASGESLRRTRIMLLKAVHILHVGLILVFESGRLYWRDRRGAKSSSRASLRGLNVSRVSRLSRSPQSGRAARNGWSTTNVTAPPLLEDVTRADQSFVSSSLVHPSFASSETIGELEVVAANLQAQLDTLSSLIAQSKSRMTVVAGEDHACSQGTMITSDGTDPGRWISVSTVYRMRDMGRSKQCTGKVRDGRSCDSASYLYQFKGTMPSGRDSEHASDWPSRDKFAVGAALLHVLPQGARLFLHPLSLVDYHCIRPATRLACRVSSPCSLLPCEIEHITVSLLCCNVSSAPSRPATLRAHSPLCSTIGTALNLPSLLAKGIS
nr:hypothetical protein CFP56_72098 [Quercus suber]